MTERWLWSEGSIASRKPFDLSPALSHSPRTVNSPLSWQEAFVAMTLSLGDSVEDALGALGRGAPGVTRELRAVLSGADRNARASTLSSILGAVIGDVEDGRIS
jgi:hypothetical protein